MRWRKLDLRLVGNTRRDRDPSSCMRVALLVTVASVCALALGQSASAAGSDQSVAYQVDVAHSGVQSDDQLAPPFGRRWKVTLPAGVSYPLIAGGYVYVTVANPGQYGTHLYALRQSDGSTAWSASIPGTYDWSNAAYDAGRVFVVNFDGLLQAFAGDTGALVWARQLPGQYAFSSPPTASAGVVYVGGAGSGGTLYAVDESNGAVLAAQQVENGDDSSPALSGSAVFVSYACNQAYGFATPSLSPLWHYSTFCEGGGGKTTVYANGRVYTRDYFGNLVLDAATGNLVRSYAPQGATLPAPAVDSTTIYSLNQGVLTAQAVGDGSVSWTFGGDGQLDTAPLVLSTSSGELVVEGSASGRLYALGASTGAVAWQTDVGSPISAPDEQNVSQPLTGLGAGLPVKLGDVDDVRADRSLVNGEVPLIVADAQRSGHDRRQGDVVERSCGHVLGLRDRPRRHGHGELLPRLWERVPDRDDDGGLHGDRHGRQLRERELPRRRERSGRRLQPGALLGFQGRAQPEERESERLLPARREPGGRELHGREPHGHVPCAREPQLREPDADEPPAGVAREREPLEHEAELRELHRREDDGGDLHRRVLGADDVSGRDEQQQRRRHLRRPSRVAQKPRANASQKSASRPKKRTREVAR